MATTSTPFPTSSSVSPGTGISSSESKNPLVEKDSSGRSSAQNATPIADDARRLADRAAQNAHTLVDRAAERVAPALDRIAPTVDRLRSRVSEAGIAVQRTADRLGDLQNQWVDDSRNSIRSHPLTWVAAAIAVGLVLGRLSSNE